MDKKALDNIAKKIRSDAELKIKEFRRIAEEKRKEILDEASRELEKELRQMRMKKEREIENQVNFIISQAKIAGKRMVLNEKEKGIDAVFEEAVLSAPEKDPTAYREYLQSSVRHMKDVLGQGTIFCRPDDESTVRSMLPPGWEVQPSLPSEMAGIIGRSSDGNMEVDFTLSRRLEDMKEALRKEVSQVLYGGEA